VYPSLGRVLYLSTLRAADLMVGNSSSGIVEAPSFALPVVNVGERQQGRLRQPNVIDCGSDRDSIAGAIASALRHEFRAGLTGMKNRFGDGRAAEQICQILVHEPLPSLVKHFNNPPGYDRAVAAWS
jgi:UDP-N-acetylglucosamine 2-epimerase